jgi:osmotically-inducible protein OsmY
MRTDSDVKRNVVAHLKSELPFSYEGIKSIVKNGWVTLEGAAEWNYQRTRAESTIRRVKGVLGVSNLINLAPRVSPAEVKAKIESTMKRSA